MPRRPSASVSFRPVGTDSGGAAPLAASGPVLVCPFSGQPLELRESPHGFFFVSPFGWFSKLFQSRLEAYEWAGWRDGKLVYNRRPEISVREVEPPEENPLKDLVE